MLPQELKSLFYRLDLVVNARRIHEEVYLNGGGGEKKKLYCAGPMPEGERVIPQDEIIRFIQKFRDEEKQIKDEISQYEVRPRGPGPLAPGSSAEATTGRAVAVAKSNGKRGRKSSRPG